MSPLFLVLVLLPLAARGERFSCRGRILGGYYADAKSGCKAFHVCVRVAGGGIRDFRFFCPPGTLFHQEAQTCTDWGDDDPLACPADLYDGQFDLYRIGSGFDTKKVTSNNQREEESEFGLQRAETGDRRLHQNSQKTASAAASASDLKTSHSSDFFTGSRDRGRDDGTPQAHHRNSFRRPTTQFPSYSTPSTYSTLEPSSQTPQEYFSKRKLIRKRPVSQVPLSTPIPKTTQSFSPVTSNSFNNKKSHVNQNVPSDQNYPNNQVRNSNIDSTSKQEFNQNLHYSGNQNNDQNYQRTQNNNFQNSQDNQNGLNRQNFENDIQYNQGTQNFQGNQLIKNQQINQFPNAQYFQKKEVDQKQNHSPRSKQLFDQEQERRRIIETEKSSTLPPYVDKDEYVEVSRITPKPHKLVNQNSEFSINPTKQRYSKKLALTELYNINSQSTPSINNNQNKEPKENYNKVTLRNYYNVAPLDEQNIVVPKNNIIVNSNGARSSSSTLGLESATHSSTPSYQSREFSRGSYEPEKVTKSSKIYQEHANEVNRGRSFTSTQIYSQNSVTSPAPLGTFSYTANSVEPRNLNNVAHKTNVGFNAKQINYDEDDGQYRLPPNEDDGQYRPELYERELLSGAHSLNIAASGNRLPEDQKPRNKPIFAQTAVPRPFSVSPDTKLTQPPQETKVQSFSTTLRPQPTTQTQKTFDYYQTYTTTSRPETYSNHFIQTTEENIRQTSAKYNPTNPSTFKQQQSQVKPSQTKKTVSENKPPAYSKPASTSEDNSYDYAYYDSDPGFSEYEPVEEFSKTKTL